MPFFDLVMTNQSRYDSAYTTFPTSTGHIPVFTTISDSEQRMVSELITSISNDSPPQQNSSTMASANTTVLDKFSTLTSKQSTSRCTLC